MNFDVSVVDPPNEGKGLNYMANVGVIGKLIQTFYKQTIGVISISQTVFSQIDKTCENAIFV